MHKKKNPARDIYRRIERDIDKDFTPQIATERQDERMRDIRRTRIAALAAGILLIALAVGLAAGVLHKFLKPRATSQNTENGNIPDPEQAVAADSLWAMDYQQVAERQATDPEARTIERVKEAAYHIFSGQQELGSPEQAVQQFQKALDIYPDILGLHGLMGALYLRNQEYKLAAEHFEKALLEEETFDAVNNLGVIYLTTEDYVRAEKYLQRALELRPENPLCHKNLALLYQKMKRDNEAVYHFEKYIDMQPDDVDTMQSCGLYLARLGRWQEAADILTRLTQEMTNVAPVYFLLAQAQIQNKRPDLAIAALKSGVQLIDPQLALAWMNRDDFAPLRNTPEFKTLLDQLKARAASPDSR